MEFVIITGLSGAGKTIALHALEDIDFYCVDNLPPVLIPTFYDLCKNSSEERMKHVSVVTNIRTGEDFQSFTEILLKLKSEKKAFKILFLDATKDVLLTRYKETRRKHPLSENYRRLYARRGQSLSASCSKVSGSTPTMLSTRRSCPRHS